MSAPSFQLILPGQLPPGVRSAETDLAQNWKSAIENIASNSGGEVNSFDVLPNGTMVVGVNDRKVLDGVMSALAADGIEATEVSELRLVVERTRAESEAQKQKAEKKAAKIASREKS